MDRIRTLGTCGGAALALLGACAVIAPQEAVNWTPPAAGSTWQMSQRNTGSYGNDAVVTVSRGEGSWQGEKVVTMTMSNNGASIMALPNGKWLAIAAKDGKPLVTYDPPIGYEFPLKVGKTWKTHHKGTNHMAGRALEFDYSCTVEGRERLAVPAGSFDALRIVCENEYSREVSWYDASRGLNVKTDFRRKPGNPSGEGTQRAELVAMKL